MALPAARSRNGSEHGDHDRDREQAAIEQEPFHPSTREDYYEPGNCPGTAGRILRGPHAQRHPADQSQGVLQHKDSARWRTEGPRRPRRRGSGMRSALQSPRPSRQRYQPHTTTASSGDSPAAPAGRATAPSDARGGAEAWFVLRAPRFCPGRCAACSPSASGMPECSGQVNYCERSRGPHPTGSFALSDRCRRSVATVHRAPHPPLRQLRQIATGAGN